MKSAFLVHRTTDAFVRYDKNNRKLCFSVKLNANLCLFSTKYTVNFLHLPPASAIKAVFTSSFRKTINGSKKSGTCSLNDKSDFNNSLLYNSLFYQCRQSPSTNPDAAVVFLHGYVQKNFSCPFFRYDR